ncbi:MAG TPA: COX15/CtaA family protein [Acidimicrobiales bacterium]
MPAETPVPGSPGPGRRGGISPQAYRRITLIALASITVIVVTGAAVRLTGSGLGCTDWPTCSAGHVAPADVHDAPAMVEFTNRTITGIVSVAVILAVLGSLRRRPRRRDLTLLSLGLVAGVLAQIVLGGLVVLLDLSPKLVMAHFLLSMAIVWNAVVLHHRAGLPDPLPTGSPASTPSPTAPEPPSPLARQVSWASRAVLGIAAVAVFTGTVVTATGPHAGDKQAARLHYPIADVARVHGMVVMVLLAAVLGVAWLSRQPGAAAGLQDQVSRLLVVLVAQAVVGYTQYFTHVPPLLVGIHVCGALAVWISAIQLQLTTSVPRAVPQPRPEPVAA